MISNFINTKINKYLLVLIYILFIFLSLYSNEDNFNYKDYYTINKNSDKNYELIIYDLNKKKIGNYVYIRQPVVSYCSQFIIKVTIKVGDPIYITFINLDNHKTSSFESFLSIDTKRLIVAFNKYDIKKNTLEIVISDLFDNKKIYKTFTRNFSKSIAVPSYIIYNARFEGNRLYFSYENDKQESIKDYEDFKYE